MEKGRGRKGIGMGRSGGIKKGKEGKEKRK